LPSAFADDDTLRERFLLETRTTAAFAHPNIVPVYGIEAHENVLAFSMAFIEGESLAERVTRAGPLSARALVRLMHDISYALAYAHGRGIVHRDIKPENVMLDRATSRALVMDFGIARPISAPAAIGEGLTRVGEVVGTPEYMSPEQACGEPLDGRSDLYSLGLVLWFAATGRTAMSGESTQRVLARQLSEFLPPIATLRTDLPPSLAAAIDRCVAKEREARFPDATTLATALDDAELAAPEVPVTIRMVANELRTAGLVATFGAGLAWAFASRGALKGFSVADQLVPLVFFGSMILARVLQALGEVARLGRLGFELDAVVRGLQAALEEAASVRAAAALDHTTRTNRRRELRTAAFMFTAAVACVVVTLQLRRPIGNGNYNVTTTGVILFFCAVALSAASVVIAARSPFRASLGERAFRRIWLGTLGRAVLRRALRSGASGLTAPTHSSAMNGSRAPQVTAVRPAPTLPVAPDDRLTRIEARLDALERRNSTIG
jgi:hypothetical protein